MSHWRKLNLGVPRISRFGRDSIFLGVPRIFIILFCVYTNAIFADKTLHVYAFRNFRLAKPEKMVLVGEIQSKTKEPSLNSKKTLSEYDTRPDRITVKIINRKNLKPGQKIYIIDKNPYHELFRDGHVVGEAEIISIYYSSFYGSWALSARGLLLRIRKGQFVARSMETESLELAYESKRKGDHYAALGKYEEAIASYRQALSNDIKLAEAHAGLAQVSFRNSKEQGKIKSIAIEALNSYEQAWKYRKNFRYRREELAFYHNYIEALEDSHQLHNRRASRETRTLKYLDRIIEAAKEAVRIETAPRKDFAGKSSRTEAKPGLRSSTALAQAHYHRMLYHDSQSNPRERKEYDHSQREADKWLKKLLAMDQKNGKSLQVAILFYYHRYQSLNTQNPKEAQMRYELRKLLVGQLGPYYNLYLNPKKERRDPTVDSILARLAKD